MKYIIRFLEIRDKRKSYLKTIGYSAGKYSNMPCEDVTKSNATRYELSDAKKIQAKISETGLFSREPFIIEVKK